MPLRNFSVKTRPSEDAFQDSASAGSVFCESRSMLMRSALQRPITSRETASVCATGFRVLGSERWPMTNLPP